MRVVQETTRDNQVQVREVGSNSWWVGLTSLTFILLQSACTVVMAVSGLRVLIGLTSLAAAAGVHHAATGFHADAIRIPMMVLAVAGSLINLFVVGRIRSLRSRPASRWRVKPATEKTKRAEWLQVGMATVTLVLIVTEWLTHHIVHDIS